MAKAKKLPSGQWRTLAYSHSEPVFLPDGKPKLDKNGKQVVKRIYKSFTDPSKKRSERMAAQFLDEKSRMDSPCHMTYGEALDKYISDRSATLSPSTIREYKRSRRTDFQMLMDIPLDNITQDMIQKAVNEEKRTHSPKSVRNMHGLLSGVMRAYRPGFALNTTLPQKVRPELHIPTDKDIKKILSYVAENCPEMEIPILLAAFGPMRRSEICALDSSDVKGNIVHVRKAMVENDSHEYVIKTTKSYAGDRFIDFPDFVAEKLHQKEGRIVELTPTAVSIRFRKILKNADVEHFRFHDLRHYSASIQHAIGIPDAYIMQRGGWGSDTVLKNVYRHVLLEKEKEMSEKANNYFKDICNTKCNTENEKAAK